MKLPIELIPDTNPPLFRWRQSLLTLEGKRVIIHRGSMPTHLEGAVVEMILLCQSQAEEISKLRRQVGGMADRIAAQSDLLTSKAEKPVTPTSQPTAPVQPPSHQPVKRGK